ncbi:contact-dependent growth inhibition system immunity protein [Baia soyae]|uniref:contact-dependent growth inhibition system immunity protein n=1 Tax=Baia soyae TaxID=1544746 RepID=UPI00243700D4|nr:contact-dependent growth inhibition system immunity protein [Baia soyae]
MWSDIHFSSYVVTTVHNARLKPLQDLTNEELRVLVGQKVSLEYVVPIAFERLFEDPFLGADLYRGDLLQAILRVDSCFWNEHIDLRFELDSIVLEVTLFFETLQFQLEEYQQLQTDCNRKEESY